MFFFYSLYQGNRHLLFFLILWIDINLCVCIFYIIYTTLLVVVVEEERVSFFLFLIWGPHRPSLGWPLSGADWMSFQSTFGSQTKHNNRFLFLVVGGYFVVVVVSYSFLSIAHPSSSSIVEKKKEWKCVDLWIFEPHHRFKPTKMKISGCPPKRWRRPAAL